MGLWLVSEGRLHPNPNACSLVISSWEPVMEVAPVDWVNDKRICWVAGIERRTASYLHMHTPRGAVWPARRITLCLRCRWTA
jgi:hypothetical protein